MFLFGILAAIWTAKIVDYTLVNNKVINNCDIYNSIILCKDVELSLLKNIKNKNIVYVYENSMLDNDITPPLSKYTHNFLLTYLSGKYDLPILTTKHNYFKPFQYNINDIDLFRIKAVPNEDPNFLNKDPKIANAKPDYTSETLIFYKETIKKNSKQFLIENEHNHLFIRL